MNITLYDGFKTSGFDRNDLILRNVTKCEVTWEKNGQFQIDLVYPIVVGDTAWKQIVKGAIVKCPVPFQNDQLFRLQSPKKLIDSSSGEESLEVTGYHITYDLNNNFLEDVRPTGKTGVEAGQYLLANTQYSHPFSWIGDITTTGTAYYIRKNVMDAILGDDDNSYLNVWGGELVRDNFNIGMFSQAGENRGVILKYGKNVLGVDWEPDDSNLMTRAMPVIDQDDNSDSPDSSSTTTQDTMPDGSTISPVIKLPEKYVDSPKINDYEQPYIKEVQVTLTDAQKNLSLDQKYQIMRDYVNNMYENEHVDVPVYSCTVNFLLLQDTKEYKNYAILETVKPYDLITLRFMDIDVTAELVGYTYDSLTKQYEQITLGNIQNDILRSTQKTLFQMTQNNQNSIKILKAQMEDIPGTILNVATSTTSGGNNLFDHSVLDSNYLSEWTISGSSSVIADNTLHDTDKVWELPPGASVSKEDVLLNPNNYSGQDLMFSLQAKYNGLTIINNGAYNNIQQTNVLLGALDAVIQRCLVDTTGTAWNYSNAGNTVVSEKVGVTGDTAITITNSSNYNYTIHAWDNEENQLADFTTGPIPSNVFNIQVEILENIYPSAVTGFSIYETNDYTAQGVVSLYANSTDSDWQTVEQNFTLKTEHPSDIIKQINFRASNDDANGTAYIGAFMINTGTVSSSYSQSSNDTVETLRAHQVIADYISAKKADIDQLSVTNATISTLNSTYATITNLNSVSANINNLKASVGNIMDLTTNTLKSHIITADNMVAGTITASSGIIAEGAIGTAEIAEVDAGKVKSGQLSTSLVTIESSSGNMYIADNTIQIKDSNRVRVQIGKDASNDYNMYVWDTNGNLMFDATGLKANGIKDKIIRNDMVSDTANIDGSKLDIDSVVTSINGSTTLLKSTQVQLNTANQTLEVAFNNLTNTVTSQGNTVQSQGTAISTMQGQISSKIWNTDITAARNALQSEITTTQTDLTQTNTAIGFNASTQSFTNATGSLSGRLSSAESNIQVQAGQISSKVSTTDYNGNTLVSMINQSSSKINASALNINLSGYVTFNSLSTAGSTTINGANIATSSMSASKISGGTLTLGGGSNGNGNEIVYNSSGKEITRLDNNGLTVTLQENSSGIYGNAFLIQASNGTKLLNIDGDGFFTFAGVMSVANQQGTVDIQSTSMIFNNEQTEIGNGNGDGATWGTYNSYISSWNGLAFGSRALTNGTFNPTFMFDCRNGEFTALGAKHRAIKTPDYGIRTLNAYETADCLFGDIGRNKLTDGKCIINIDPIFLETINTSIQYEVKTWAYGNGNVWVETSDMYPAYFIVHGSADIEFGYEIVAKQKDYEEERLKEM